MPCMWLNDLIKTRIPLLFIYTCMYIVIYRSDFERLSSKEVLELVNDVTKLGKIRR